MAWSNHTYTSNRIVMSQLSMSVVIPTYNRYECWTQLCRDLYMQDCLPLEIIVIDQSEDPIDMQNIFGTPPPTFRYLHSPIKNRSHAKNIGLAQANGDLILFCDDDVRVSPDFVKAHVDIYQRDPKIMAASCRLTEQEWKETDTKNVLKMTFYGRLISNENSSWSGYVGIVNGGNMSFRKDILARIGGFDENLLGTSLYEETDISFRIRELGFSIYHDASTTVFHYPQRNGNVATKKERPLEWYYSYYYNLIYVYAKNRLLFNLPFVIAYTLLRIFYTSYRTEHKIHTLFLLLKSIPRACSAAKKEPKSNYMVRN